MESHDCDDKIRVTISDKSGVLRFESFDIVNSSDCQDLAAKLREYLVGRPLSEVDVEAIRSLPCKGERQCMRSVVNIISNYQDTFAASKE